MFPPWNFIIIILNCKIYLELQLETSVVVGGDLHIAPKSHNACGASPYEFSFHYRTVINAVWILGGHDSKK